MAAIEVQPRAASVVAHDTVVALKLNSATFLDVGKKHPQIWLAFARELARRLLERNKLIQAPNEHPKLFIISSSEALPVAREIQDGLQHDVLTTVWTDVSSSPGV